MFRKFLSNLLLDVVKSTENDYVIVGDSESVGGKVNLDSTLAAIIAILMLVIVSAVCVIWIIVKKRQYDKIVQEALDEKEEREKRQKEEQLRLEAMQANKTENTLSQNKVVNQAPNLQSSNLKPQNNVAVQQNVQQPVQKTQNVANIQPTQFQPSGQESATGGETQQQPNNVHTQPSVEQQTKPLQENVQQPQAGLQGALLTQPQVATTVQPQQPQSNTTPQQGVVQPQNNIAPSQNNAMLQPGAVQPQSNTTPQPGAVQPQNNTTPQQNVVAPPQNNTTIQQGVVQSQNNSTPQQNVVQPAVTVSSPSSQTGIKRGFPGKI